VVEKALAKNRDDRFLSADEMYEALLPFKGNDGVMPATTSMLTGLPAESKVPYPSGFNPVNDDGTALGSSRGLVGETDAGILRTNDSLRILTRRPILIFVVFVAVAAAGTIGLWMGLAFNDSAVREERLTAEAASARSGAPARDRVAEEVADREPEPVVPVGQTPPKTVIIEIEGLPNRARVAVDDVTSSLPLTLPQSDAPRILKVKAPGYTPHEQKLVPSKNQKLSISLKKMKPKRVKRTPKRRSPPEEGKKAWRDNPFAD
jgi:hypothetical protein